MGEYRYRRSERNSRLAERAENSDSAETLAQRRKLQGWKRFSHQTEGMELHLFLKKSNKSDEKLARTALGMWSATLQAKAM